MRSVALLDSVCTYEKRAWFRSFVVIVRCHSGAMLSGEKLVGRGKGGDNGEKTQQRLDEEIDRVRSRADRKKRVTFRA